MGTLEPDTGPREDGEVAAGDELAAAPPAAPEPDPETGDLRACGEDEYVPV